MFEKILIWLYAVFVYSDKDYKWMKKPNVFYPQASAIGLILLFCFALCIATFFAPLKTQTLLLSESRLNTGPFNIIYIPMWILMLLGLDGLWGAYRYYAVEYPEQTQQAFSKVAHRLLIAFFIATAVHTAYGILIWLGVLNV